MRKLEYSVQHQRSDNGVVSHSHQTLVWDDESEKNHTRFCLHMFNIASGSDGWFYEDRFPHKDRFNRYTK